MMSAVRRTCRGIDRGREAFWCGARVLVALLVIGAGRTSLAQPAPAQAPAADPAAAPAASPAQPAPAESIESLPQLANLPLPTAEQFLTEPPHDWIVLTGDYVLVVEPVVPRPDTLAKIDRAYNDLLRLKPTTPPEEMENLQARIDEQKFLAVILPGESELPEYRIPIKMVKQVLHHEDLVLRRIDQLVEANEIDVAMELQILMERRYGTWIGVADRHNKLVLADARLRLQTMQFEPALVLAEELFRRDSQLPGLSEVIEGAGAAWGERAWGDGNIANVQHVYRRIRAMRPESAAASAIADRLAGEARRILAEADEAAARGDVRTAALRAEVAAAVWPELPEMKARHRAHLLRYPRLHVGTVRTVDPRGRGPRLTPSRADLREQSLRPAPLFHPERVQGGLVSYRTRYFNDWEPEDLGRRMLLTLRTHAQPWEMQGPLSAESCGEALLARLDSASPAFDERLATYVDSVRVQTPYSLTIEFRRVPARIEPILARIAVGEPEPPAAGEGGSAEPPPQQPAHRDDGAGGFTVREETDVAVSYRRARPEPGGQPRYRTAEVVEHVYDSPDRAYRALVQGEVSLVPDLPAWFVRELQAIPETTREFHVRPMALPLTHFLQFNPRSVPLRNRELRRALASSVPREAILSDVLLRGLQRQHGRVSRTPFPEPLSIARGDFPPLEYDVPTAIAMSLAAAHQLGNGTELPVLRLVAPGEPVERAACEALVRAWKRVGIQVEIISADGPPPPADWDILYRAAVLTEPTIDLWPLVTASPVARIADLDHLPSWLRHDLIELDRITDSARASEFARAVLRKVLADCAVIPLWETDSFQVVRKTVRDLPAVPMQVYDSLDRWTIEPWYRMELP
ncbi:ABC transporter substrate-binding protein [Planctomyces sp. SH-PL14]|uniref:ABC transporter substrate-binding protein n=1 Tax=Planctomyces sp. SH-PL14 TaxID=1632864 RepID=UPI00078E529A|nr:ABC transporter substrate-binding protein [Planctomyces sp. SH-PL14]AMV18379.1 extracellular solute-binding protein [Planctomyces sp. SH-PL14]